MIVWTMLEHEVFLKLLRIQANTWHKISGFQTFVTVYGNITVLGQAPDPNRASVASRARRAFTLLTSALDSWYKWGIAHFCSRTLIFGILLSVPKTDGVFWAMTMQEPTLRKPNIAAFTLVVVLVV